MDHVYFLSKTPDPAQGYRFIHQEGCAVRPADADVDELGSFDSPEEAVAHARQTVPEADGCAMCCPNAHTMTQPDDA